jgi:hypothetical protein
MHGLSMKHRLSGLNSIEPASGQATSDVGGQRDVENVDDN